MRRRSRGHFEVEGLTAFYSNARGTRIGRKRDSVSGVESSLSWKIVCRKILPRVRAHQRAIPPGKDMRQARTLSWRPI